MNHVTTTDRTEFHVNGSGRTSPARSVSTAKGIAHATPLDRDEGPHGRFATEKMHLTKDLLAPLR